LSGGDVSRGGSLVKNTVVFAVGSFGQNLLPFIMMRFYTGILDKGDFTKVAALTAICNILLPILSLCIYDGVLRFAMHRDADKSAVFSVGMRLSLAGAAITLIAGIGLMFWPGINRVYLWLVLAQSISTMLLSLMMYFLRAIGRTVLFAISTVAQAMIIVLCNILFLGVFRFGVVGYMASYIAGSITALLLSFIGGKLWNSFRIKKPDSALQGKMIKFSIPLMLNALCYIAITSTIILFVERFCEESQQDLFTAANKIAAIMIVINTIFILAWQLSANVEYGQNDYPRFVGRVNTMYQSIFLMAGASITILAKPIIFIMTDESIHGSWQYVPLLVLGTTLFTFGQFLGVLYIAGGKPIRAFITNGVTAVCSLCVGFVLTKHLGILGACVGQIITYLVFWLLRLFTLRKEIDSPKWGRSVLLSGLVFTALTAVITWDFPYAFYIGLGLWAIMLAMNFKVLLKMLDWVRRNFLGLLKRRIPSADGMTCGEN